MLSRETLKSIAIISIGSLLLTAIMLIIFAISRNFNSKVILGGIAGTFYSILNFILLAITVEKMLSKEEKAKANLTAELSYVARFFLTAVFVIWSIKAEYINYLAAIIPIIFPQLIIRIYGFTSIRKRSDEK
ncbi:MAG: ATP synthase subunit I [Monoglobales bacterium]